MPAKRSTPPSPLVAAAEAFDETLARFASLTEALQPEAISGYAKQATGKKYLITPLKGGTPSP